LKVMSHTIDNNAASAAGAVMLPMAHLGGVLSYRTSGHNRPCGQVIGANGVGDFCLLIIGTPEQADEHSRQHLRDLEAGGHTITNVIFTPNDDMAGYTGNPVRVVSCCQNGRQLRVPDL